MLRRAMNRAGVARSGPLAEAAVLQNDFSDRNFLVAAAILGGFLMFLAYY